MVFERFTDRARRVVVLAQEEARLLGHNWIGTEHLLLGLLHEGEGLARQALDALGVNLEAVQAEVRRMIPPVADQPRGHVPFTPRAKKVLELSLREALQLGHNYIDTEHLLLGVVREGEGMATQLLAGQGVEPQRVYDEVFGMMTPGSPGPRWFTGGPGGRGPSPHTPAGRRVERRARGLAERHPVGTHHFLMALLADPDSLASKVLTSLGVTQDAVTAKVEEMGTAGTADEVPQEVAGRGIQVRVEGTRLEVSVGDPELVQRLEEVVVSGRDPAGGGVPAVWQARRPPPGDVSRSPQGDPPEGPVATTDPAED